ncbi:MAG: hypothetical protein WD737_14590 [Gemmatimonadota bacterium]
MPHRSDRLGYCLILALLIAACGDTGPRVDAEEEPIASDWAEIASRDTLVALTQFNSTGYFIYRGAPMRFEHDLLERSVEALGTRFGMGPATYCCT